MPAVFAVITAGGKLSETPSHPQSGMIDALVMMVAIMIDRGSERQEWASSANSAEMVVMRRVYGRRMIAFV